MRFMLNDSEVRTGAPSGLPVLDLLRRQRRLVGTKEGCREGDCGACLVLLGELAGDHVHYRSATSCLLPLGDVAGRHLVTIEGINRPEEDLTPVQQALVDEGAIQCGFCTPGVVVAITGWLLSGAGLGIDDAIAAVEGNICRCTGYLSIRRALQRLVERYSRLDDNRLDALIADHVVPPAFAGVAQRLAALDHDRPSRPAPGQPVVAGGTDAYVQRLGALRGAEPFLISGAGLDGIRREGENVVIGAATTTEALRHSELLEREVPGLFRALRLVSSEPIRNRATVAGNLVNASPIGDLSVILLALGAEVGLGRDRAGRTLPLTELFTAYKQLAMAPGELIHWVRFPVSGGARRFSFEKVSKRVHLDIATVNSAAAVVTRDGVPVEVVVSAGGVAPVPLVLTRASAHLRGHPVTADRVRQAADLAAEEIAPISDVRGSAAYRRLLVRQLVLAHANTLFGLEEGWA